MNILSPTALIWLCTVFKERYGLAFTLVQTKKGLLLKLANSGQGEILFPNQLEAFTRASSDLPFTEWSAGAEGWQAVLQQPLPMPGWRAEDLAIHGQPLIELSTGQALIHYDIPGLTYWMLNRIEEIGRTDLDSHGRFPATSSSAYQHGYLERPVVDEWLHVLGQVIQKVWPQVQLKQHSFSMKISHDVDSPSLYAFKPWKTILRMMAGHLIKRRDLKATLQAPWLKLIGRNGIPKQDPHNTFDWIMQVSEANNLASAFYFICGGNHRNDADYQPEDQRTRQLMRKMHRRGHEIGLHPSYAAYQDPDAIKQEADRLRSICKEEGIGQSEFGGRMHYLRWKQPVTLRGWAEAGMDYDSSLGYADRPGFRCGTCFEYPAFDPVAGEMLPLRIRPLIVMECTIIDSIYLGLGTGDQALKKFNELKSVCATVGGCFTLLWHNSSLDESGLRELYFRIVQVDLRGGG